MIDTEVKKSNIKEDTLYNNAMTILFDKLYKWMSTNYNINFERVFDKERQLVGIDVIWRGSNWNCNVDEKCATAYFNKDLKTFAFELENSSYRDGSSNKKRFPGWFNEDCKNNKTQVYAIGFVRADNKTDVLTSNVNNLRVMFIKKTDLKKLVLSETGFKTCSEILKYYKSRKELKNTTQHIAINKKEEKMITKKLFLSSGFSISESTGLAENPINILIPKRYLAKTAFFDILIDYKKHDYIILKNSLKCLNKNSTLVA